MIDATALVEVVSARSLFGTVASLRFDDGVAKVVDLSPLMTGQVFDEVRRMGWTTKFRVDTELGTIVWPNGADLPPARLRFEAPTLAETGGSHVSHPSAVWADTMVLLREAGVAKRQVKVSAPAISVRSMTRKISFASGQRTEQFTLVVPNRKLTATTRKFVEDSEKVKLPA
ncbi:DUF2442 domain-containing protein [Nocardioides sp. WS12]|uniref:DUF2442 domain-containing protein n=1 Tax=Nocardioides sp. WS12 TaxID=2486272 RepID=UPI0015FAC1BE|nr:DUF2442 domain-containing protein [Nocardioides sp. WS12]